MKQIKILAAALMTMVCAASCKKATIDNPVSTPPTITEKRIVEEKNITNGDLNKYSYDAQGRVIKRESTTHSWTIEYLPSMIKVTRKRIAGDVFLGTEEYTIDAS